MTTKSVTDTPLFDKVRSAVQDAKLIAWDGCHKIYLAMDDIEAEWFRQNYATEPVVGGDDEVWPTLVVESDPDTMLATIGEWWEASCGLRFVSSVGHHPVDPNLGFASLIDQFEEEDDDEDWLVYFPESKDDLA